MESTRCDPVIAAKFEQASWLLFEIARWRDFWSLARHPFLRRFRDGALTDAELRTYASEHHHVVVALAVTARRAANAATGMLGERLAEHADAREREVELWFAFARASGWYRSSSWSFGAEPLAETEAAVAVLTGTCAAERTLGEDLVAIHALAQAQGVVAGRQRDALEHRHGWPADGATRYFDVRAADEGASLIEAALTGALPVEDPYGLLNVSRSTFRAYWELHDGVQRVDA